MSVNAGILGGVVGSVFGVNPRGSQHNALGAILSDYGDSPVRRGTLLASALTLVQRCGGLGAMLDRLRANGLGDRADSWLGRAPVLPLAPSEFQLVFGADAAGTALSPLEGSDGEPGEAMARILPELIRLFAPQGRLAANHAQLLAKGLAILTGAGA